jgi:DNA-binding FadR family transcriptional regulator
MQQGSVRKNTTRALHERIIVDLGQEIVTGGLKPGERLPSDQELIERFEASRTAIREAMKVLSTKGLIEARQRAGTRVRPRAEWDLLDSDVLGWHTPDAITDSFLKDLEELRELIEPEAAGLAAMRATDEDIEVMERAFLRMAASAADRPAFAQADQEFHLAILNASHNQLIRKLKGITGTVLSVLFKLQTEVNSPVPKANIDAHRQIFVMIRDGDRRGAERAMRQTIRNGAKTIAMRRKRQRAVAS